MFVFFFFYRYERHVNQIDLNGTKWNVRTMDGEADSFDAVVLTMPVPQLFGLGGTVKNILGMDVRYIIYSFLLLE